MKSTVAPSPFGILIALIISIAIVAVVISARLHHAPTEPLPQISATLSPDMSGETEAENLPDFTPFPTPTGMLPDKGWGTKLGHTTLAH